MTTVRSSAKTPRTRCPCGRRGVASDFLERRRWMGQRRHWASERRRRATMTMKRITVAQHERALVWKNKTFAGVLEPGKHWLIAPMSDIEAQLYDLTVPEFEHPRVDFLVKEARDTMEKYFDIVELTESEVGLVCKNGKLTGMLAPGKRQLYWKGPIEVKVEKIDLTADIEVPARIAKLLVRAKQPLLAQA